jgi:hypothetical protein
MGSIREFLRSPEHLENAPYIPRKRGTSELNSFSESHASGGLGGDRSSQDTFQTSSKIL